MKRTLFRKIFWSTFFVVVFFGTVAIAASTGVIDPNNLGDYKAAFLDSGVVADTAINFGKFTTESQYNITVTSAELRGYAWGSSVGWMVMNCADTTSGCSATNGNFKVANDGTGKLSGYAWGENTGWINFGPFTDTSISTVKIDTSTGNFAGTLGSAGYAWSQNYGWIKFDCGSPSTCVNTDWRPPTTGGTTSGGSGNSNNGNQSPGGNTSTVTVTVSDIVCDSNQAFPHWGANGGPDIKSYTATNYVANSNGHCHFGTGQYYQWGGTNVNDVRGIFYGILPAPWSSPFGPTTTDGTVTVSLPFDPTTIPEYRLREVLQGADIPFTYQQYDNNNHPDSAEFYCNDDVFNYDNYDFIRNFVGGGHYYCISWNTALPSGTPQGPSQSPIPTDPAYPAPTSPSEPPSTGGSQNPGNSNGSTTTAPGGTTNPGNGGNAPSYPIQPGGNTTPPGGPTQAPPAITTEPPNNPAESTNEPGPFGNGITLPPALSESLGGIVSSIGTVVSVTMNTLGSAGQTMLAIARTSAGQTVSTVVTAVGIASTAAAAFATLLIANPFALSEIALLPFRLWTLLLVFFGYKKRSHPWGVVYDSVTKQPIDPAYVVLMDLQGNEIATSITDIDGRYGFSVAPGTYKIVANKTNFEFPSKKLIGKTGDELYNDLYFGEEIVVKEENEIIAKNIPLDQLNFDWNEFAKNEQKRLSYFHHSDLIIARLSNLFFWLGFIIATISILASHTLYNSIVFLIYVLLYVVRKTSRHFKPKGSISEVLTDQPMPFAILHVISPGTNQEITHKVADRIGNYYCLLPNGTYSIVIDRKNADASYTKIPVAEPVTVTQGYLNKTFKV